MGTAFAVWLSGFWAVAAGMSPGWSEGFEGRPAGAVLSGGAAVVSADRAAEGGRSARLVRPVATTPAPKAPASAPAPTALTFDLPDTLRTGRPVWFDGRFWLDRSSCGAVVSLAEGVGGGRCFVFRPQRTRHRSHGSRNTKHETPNT